MCVPTSVVHKIVQRIRELEMFLSQEPSIFCSKKEFQAVLEVSISFPCWEGSSSRFHQGLPTWLAPVLCSWSLVWFFSWAERDNSRRSWVFLESLRSFQYLEVFLLPSWVAISRLETWYEPQRTLVKKYYQKCGFVGDFWDCLCQKVASQQILSVKVSKYVILDETMSVARSVVSDVIVREWLIVFVFLLYYRYNYILYSCSC